MSREFFAGCVELGKMPGVLRFELVGAAMYLEPINDYDILVLVGENFAIAPDWQPCMSDAYETPDHNFRAYRKGMLNFIVLTDEELYKRYLLAAAVCAAVKVQDKKDRIVVHRMIRDGKTEAQAREDL